MSPVDESDLRRYKVAVSEIVLILDMAGGDISPEARELRRKIRRAINRSVPEQATTP